MPARRFRRRLMGAGGGDTIFYILQDFNPCIENAHCFYLLKQYHAGIHDVVGVQGPLDGPHEFIRHVIDLASDEW